MVLYLMDWIDVRPGLGKVAGAGDQGPGLTRDRSTAGNREFWDYAERTAAEVRGWPAWKSGKRVEAMRGEESANHDG